LGAAHRYLRPKPWSRPRLRWPALPDQHLTLTKPARPADLASVPGQRPGRARTPRSPTPTPRRTSSADHLAGDKPVSRYFLPYMGFGRYRRRVRRVTLARTDGPRMRIAAPSHHFQAG